MEKYFDIIREYLTHHQGVIYLVMGILLLIAFFTDPDWLSAPPYTARNVVGRMFGRTVYLWTIGVLATLLVVIGSFLLSKGV